MPTCVKCKASIEEGGRFCDACGSEQPQNLYCDNCGTALEPGARFCDACGKASGQEIQAVKTAQPGALNRPVR